MFNSEHKFKTEKQDKKSNIIRFICAFLAFALVFGSISAVVILKHNDISLKDVFGGKEESETAEDGGSTVDLGKEISGSSDYLFYCSNSDLTEMYFMAIVTADLDGKVFNVRMVKPDNPNYLSELKTGGYKALISAVEKDENVKISKYAGSNAETFALAINYMGGLEYTVDSRIEYRTDDFTLILTKGDQTIKGETLIKLFRYEKTFGKKGLEVQGKLICKMLDDYIVSENLEGEKGLTIYQKVLSKIDTNSDISYIDAAKIVDNLKVFCNSDNRRPAEVVTKPQEVTTDEK